MSRNLRRLLGAEWKGAPVTVSAFGQSWALKTDDGGDILLRVEAPPAAPFSPGLHPISLSVPGARARTFVQIVSPQAPFMIVSDFDDTVAVTEVVSVRKLIGNAIFKDAYSQAPVPGMDAWYRCMLEGKAAQPGLAFVSGTPRGFLPRMRTFLRLHHFPPAALYLRDFGLATLKGYKEPVLERLLTTFEHPVLLRPCCSSPRGYPPD